MTDHHLSDAFVALAERRALRAMTCFFEDHLRTITAGAFTSIATLAAQLARLEEHAGGKAKLAFATEVNREALKLLADAARAATDAAHRSLSNANRTIACLRLTQLARSFAPRRVGGSNDQWRLVQPEDDAFRSLSEALRAMEQTLRGLLRACYPSDELLTAYLDQCAMLKHSTESRGLHDLYLSDVVKLLVNNDHWPLQLNALFQFDDMLKSDKDKKKVLREHFGDICFMRNQVVHVKPVGEESLYLYNLEAAQIVTPIQQAIGQHRLQRVEILQSIYTMITPIEGPTPPALATDEPVRPSLPAATPLHADCEDLKELQAQLRRRYEGGHPDRPIRLDAGIIPFVLVPNTVGAGRYFFMARAPSSSPAGEPLLSEGQVLRALARETAAQSTVRLPTVQELHEALVPLGPAGLAIDNPFGLAGVNPEQACWAHDEGGALRLIDLRWGPDDLQTRGQLRWVLR